MRLIFTSLLLASSLALAQTPGEVGTFKVMKPVTCAQFSDVHKYLTDEHYAEVPVVSGEQSEDRGVVIYMNPAKKTFSVVERLVIENRVIGCMVSAGENIIVNEKLIKIEKTVQNGVKKPM